jgi:hypothetical protein
MWEGDLLAVPDREVGMDSRDNVQEVKALFEDLMAIADAVGRASVEPCLQRLLNTARRAGAGSVRSRDLLLKASVRYDMVTQPTPADPELAK